MPTKSSIIFIFILTRYIFVNHFYHSFSFKLHYSSFNFYSPESLDLDLKIIIYSYHRTLVCMLSWNRSAQPINCIKSIMKIFTFPLHLFHYWNFRYLINYFTELIYSRIFLILLNMENIVSIATWNLVWRFEKEAIIFRFQFSLHSALLQCSTPFYALMLANFDFFKIQTCCVD
jgi:hypothetical protein